MNFYCVFINSFGNDVWYRTKSRFPKTINLMISYVSIFEKDDVKLYIRATSRATSGGPNVTVLVRHSKVSMTSVLMYIFFMKKGCQLSKWIKPMSTFLYEQLVLGVSENCQRIPRNLGPAILHLYASNFVTSRGGGGLSPHCLSQNIKYLDSVLLMLKPGNPL